MWAEAATAALTGAGLRAVEDLNAPGAVGVGRPPVNVLDGRRMSTSIAYIDPVRDLPNLDVRAGVLVDRVAFDGARTTGVVLADGETIAAAEVVLAAGAFMSPAILLRSGIGAADDVRALGAGVVADLSGVGRNLADHPAVSIDLAYPLPLGEHSLFETVATLHSSHVDKESSPPDLQILAGGPFPHDDGSAVCFMAASVLKPASRGSVRVTSPDPAAPPVIDLGYYRKEGDLSRLFEGLEVVETALAQSSVGTVTAGRLTPRMRDDADGRREALARTWTYYHPVGTAAMGPDPEAGAVVDPQCRVHGVEGLSVVDASVMPDIVAANTNITTIAIAERYVELRSRAAVPAARAGSDTAVRA